MPVLPTWDDDDGSTMATLIRVKGVTNRSQSELAALIKTAKWIGIDPDWLASVMAFESGLDPSRVNSDSGATGLIQFLPSTAQRLGTTTGALKKMSFIQQLEYVKKYFMSVRGRLKSLEDTYLVVFYPKAIGQPLNYIVGDRNSSDPHSVKVWEQNRGFAKNPDGTYRDVITKADITSTIRGVYRVGLQNPRVTVATGLGAIAMAAAVGFGIHRLYTNNGKFSS